MKQKEEREGGGKRAVQVFQPFQQRREPRATFPGPDQSFLARYKLRYRGHSTELHVQAKVPRYRPPTGLVEPSPAHPLITHPPTHPHSIAPPKSIHPINQSTPTRPLVKPALLPARCCCVPASPVPVLCSSCLLLLLRLPLLSTFSSRFPRLALCLLPRPSIGMNALHCVCPRP